MYTTDDASSLIISSQLESCEAYACNNKDGVSPLALPVHVRAETPTSKHWVKRAKRIWVQASA